MDRIGGCTRTKGLALSVKGNSQHTDCGRGTPKCGVDHLTSNESTVQIATLVSAVALRANGVSNESGLIPTSSVSSTFNTAAIVRVWVPEGVSNLSNERNNRIEFLVLPRSFTDPHVLIPDDTSPVVQSELGDEPKGVPALSRRSVML